MQREEHEKRMRVTGPGHLLGPPRAPGPGRVRCKMVPMVWEWPGKREVEGCCEVGATEVSQQVGAVGRRGVVWSGALETVHALSDREGREGSSRTMPQFLT